MDQKDRQAYNDMAQKDKERYDEALAQFRESVTFERKPVVLRERKPSATIPSKAFKPVIAIPVVMPAAKKLKKREIKSAEKQEPALPQAEPEHLQIQPRFPTPIPIMHYMPPHAPQMIEKSCDFKPMRLASSSS